MNIEGKLESRQQPEEVQRILRMDTAKNITSRSGPSTQSQTMPGKSNVSKSHAKALKKVYANFQKAYGDYTLLEAEINRAHNNDGQTDNVLFNTTSNEANQSNDKSGKKDRKKKRQSRHSKRRWHSRQCGGGPDDSGDTSDSSSSENNSDSSSSEEDSDDDKPTQPPQYDTSMAAIKLLEKNLQAKSLKVQTASFNKKGKVAHLSLIHI